MPFVPAAKGLVLLWAFSIDEGHDSAIRFIFGLAPVVVGQLVVLGLPEGTINAVDVDPAVPTGVLTVERDLLTGVTDDVEYGVPERFTEPCDVLPVYAEGVLLIPVAEDLP